MNEAMNRRRFKIVLIYLLLLSPWIVVGAINALQPAANSPLDWVDANFAPRADYDAFSKRFGAADVVVISWPGCTIDNGGIDRFTQALRTLPNFFDDEHWLFHHVVSGRELHQSFSSREMGLSDQQVRQRLAGPLLGPDGSKTAILIAFNTRQLNEGSTRAAAVHAAYKHCGRAMIQTTLICGTGLAIFALSDFMPTARFAWMMVALLTCAIIGDLVVLPAILLSPVGIVFEHRRSKRNADHFKHQLSENQSTIEERGSDHISCVPNSPILSNYSVSVADVSK